MAWVDDADEPKRRTWGNFRWPEKEKRNDPKVIRVGAFYWFVNINAIFFWIESTPTKPVLVWQGG